MKNTLPDTFKELNLTQLKNYAKDEWAVNFSIEFDRIILFRIRNPRKALHQQAMQGSILGRYLILFELKWSASIASSSFQKMIQATAATAFQKMIQATAKEAGVESGGLLLSECFTMFKLWSDDIFGRYKRLVAATGQSLKGDYSTIHDPNIERNRKLLMDDNFHRVYNDKPNYDFHHDWIFRVKDPYKGLPYSIKEEDGYFWILYDSTKKDFSTVDIQRKTAEQDHDDFIEKKVFPCKPETLWRDVEITMLAHEYVKIKTPLGEASYHFKDLRMRDGRTFDKPSDLWTLLGVFCKYSGRIDSKTQIHGFKNLSKSISDLNRKFKGIFGINEAFCHKYNKKDGWVAKCIFNDDTF